MSVLTVCSVKVLLKAHLHTPQQSKSPHAYWLLLNEAALIQRALRDPALAGRVRGNVDFWWWETFGTFMCTFDDQDEAAN